MKNNSPTSCLLTLSTSSNPIASFCLKGTHHAVMAALISLPLLTAAIAADFSGNLKGVTITDAQATNKAPIASFTYSISNNNVNLDASTSSDPDGTISQYKWDVGSGPIISGQTTSYALGTIPTNNNITLTVIDNAGAIAITQQTIYTTSCSTAFYQGPDTGTNTYKANSDNTNTYSGGTWAGEDKKLCGVQFYIAAVVGNISSKQFNIKIYSTDINNKIQTLKGTSNTIIGSDIKNGWSSIIKFATPLTVSKGDAIVLTEYNNIIDNTNYLILSETQTTGSKFKEGIWGSTFSNTRSFDRAVLAKLYE